MPTVALILLLLILAALCLAIGYQVAIARYQDQRQAVDQRRRALDTEWQALDRARRVGMVFFAARKAMRDEADRHQRGA